MRAAGIDCGTNSIRLLIADDAGTGLREVERCLAVVRLGQGVDASGEFHPEALERTFEAVDEYAAAIEKHQCDAVRFVATSAARDAGNAEAFFDGVRRRLGVEAEVISGTEEATLSYRGAVQGLPGRTGDEPVLVMDIGGGSTELILGGSEGITAQVSLDIGSVRLTERFVAHDPPRPAELAEAAALVDQELADSGLDLDRVGTWIGVAGTVTSLSAIAQGLQSYDRARVHASVLPGHRVAELAEEIAGRTAQQRVAAYGLHPRRADVIACGALIAARVGVRIGLDLLVSETDILDGIVLGLLGDLRG